MRKKFYFMLAATLFLSGNSFSQEKNPDELEKCSQHYQTAKLITSKKEDRRVAEANALLDAKAKLVLNRLKSNPKAALADTLKIPVVFHIVTDGGVENITDAQVIESIVQVNEDFNGLNSDFDQIDDDFKAIAAHVNFKFYLAKRDPCGLPTNAINRVHSVLTSNGEQQGINELIDWPRGKYLNVWVVRSSNGSNGSAFAYTPASVIDRPVIDGVMTSHWAVGRTGTARSTHYKILTHEIGHWANLAHCWGLADQNSAAACNDDDGVADTPNTDGNSGCGPASSCGSKDNTENFMDYSNCSKMFTEGQKARMLAALTSPISERNNLHTTLNLMETGVIPAPVLAVWVQDTNIVRPGTTVTYTDASVSELAENITTWEWTFEGGTPATFNGQNPGQVTYNDAGTFAVTLKVTGDDGSTHTRTKVDGIVVENYFAPTVSVSTFEVCEGTFYDSGIRGNHGDAELKVITFKPTIAGQKLEIDFVHFNLEPKVGKCFDFIEVYNGLDTNATSLGQFCGKTPPIGLFSDNADGALTFKFVSDPNTVNSGFKALINCRDQDYVSTDFLMSNTEIVACEGKFFDSGKRVNYKDGEKAVMIFRPGIAGGKVKINFTEFFVEDDGCGWDYMRIFDGTDTLTNMIGKYCGTNSPGEVTATNLEGAITVHFVADGNSNFPGWEADISCIASNELIAGFKSDIKAVCAGSTVNFESISGGTPTGFEWTFEGGTPATSTDENPSVTYSTSGSYEVTLKVTKDAESNEVTKADYITVFDVQQLPLSEGFEGSFPPTDWEINNPDGSFTWEQSTAAGQASSSAMIMNNADNAVIGELDEITLPPYDFSDASDVMSFYVAYTMFNATSPDQLKVMMSDDCGATWSTVFDKTHTDLQTKEIAQASSNAWVPGSADDWRKEEVDITSFKGKTSVLIKFQNVSGYGTSIWIDNINIDIIDGVNKFAVKGLSVYPNPSNNLFNLSFNADLADNYSIEVKNIVGQTILTKSLNNFSGKYNGSLNLSNEANGVYILTIKNSNGASIKKLIKQ